MLDKLPEQMYASLEDAIIVSDALGVRYLWIDQYYIDQDANETIKSRQLAQMNTIYNNALVTIFAVAGDVTSGLPGVRGTRKATPPRLLTNSAVVSIRAENLLRKSRWITRAWTYQEAVFARRRLVFDQQQVYLECQMRAYAEPHVGDTGDIW